MIPFRPRRLRETQVSPVTTSPALLTIEEFSLEFRTRQGRVKALDQVGLSLARGEILGIVGESGSGKSVLAYAIMGLTHRSVIQATLGAWEKDLTSFGSAWTASRSDSIRSCKLSPLISGFFAVPLRFT